ncbi:MAG: hypothetical protein BRC24_01385 [Parcubacteria group bacterium SW_4_46_8]|nr:MAG: hypothetical protein BRC24_01385 [Parcubacteria group bacterium SW_4_46_8]
MDEQELKEMEEMVRENRQLAEENNELLHKIYRSVIWRRIISIMYWVLIIGIAVGAFYFLQPIIAPFVDVYDQFRSGFSSTTPADIQQVDGNIPAQSQ